MLLFTSRSRRRSFVIVLATSALSIILLVKEQVVILGPSIASYRYQYRNTESATTGLDKQVVANDRLHQHYDVSRDTPSLSPSALNVPNVTSFQSRNTSHSLVTRSSIAIYNDNVKASNVNNSNSSINTAVEQVTSWPLCTREQIKVGKWVPVTLKAPPYIVSTSHLKCYPDETYHQGFWNTYEWQPDDTLVQRLQGEGGTISLSDPAITQPTTACQLSRWNSNDFCTLMRRSTILIIGDSLSWEHFRSLNHLLGKRHVSQHTMWESKLSQDNIKTYVCRNQVRLVFRRDDLLTNVSNSIFHSKTFPQVIVLNRGAHYKNDTTLLADMTDVVIPSIQSWQQQCTQLGMKCHLFWRTSVPGHIGCDKSEHNFTAPVNDLTTMEGLIANKSLYNNRTIEYHWYDYQHQNQLVVDLVQKHFQQPSTKTTLFNGRNSSVGDEGGEGNEYHHGNFSALGGRSSENTFDIIDAYYLNVLRPDEHRAHQGDCLHNCYPGKMDLYSQLLLHFLKMQRTERDVEDLIAFQDAIRSQLNSNGTNVTTA